MEIRITSHLERLGYRSFHFAHISESFPARISHQGGGQQQREKIARLRDFASLPQPWLVGPPEEPIPVGLRAPRVFLEKLRFLKLWQPKSINPS
jgi:hypothetical protein